MTFSKRYIEHNGDPNNPARGTKPNPLNLRCGCGPCMAEDGRTVPAVPPVPDVEEGEDLEGEKG